jgi:hypothetical protein
MPVHPCAFHCPDRILSRAESAVFVERGEHVIPDLPYIPPVTLPLVDVAPTYWGFGWIESQTDGFTAGCL